MSDEVISMGEAEIEVKPSLPPDYVSLSVLRERWLKRQEDKKREEEEREKRECEGGLGRDGVDDGGEGKGKGKVVEEGSSSGVEKRGRNVGREDRISRSYGRYGGDGKMVEGLKGGGERRGNEGRRVDEGEGFSGERRRFGRGFGVGKGNVVEGFKGYGERRVNEGDGTFGGDPRRFGRGFGLDKGKVVEGSKGYGERRVNEGEGTFGGDLRRFGRGFGLDKGKVVEGSKGYGERRVNEGEGVGGDPRRFGRGFGLDKGKGKGKVVESSRGNGDRRINEAEDDGGDCRRFGRGFGVVKGESEVGKRSGVEGLKDYVYRWLFEGEGVSRDQRTVGRCLGVGKDMNEVEKRNVVGGEVLEGSKGYDDSRRVNKGVNEVQKGNLVGGDVLEGSKGYGNRIINEEVDGGRDRRAFGKDLAVGKGKNEVKKGSVMDGKMSEGLKNEPVDIALQFGSWDISVVRDIGVEYGGGQYCRGFGKVSAIGKGQNEVEKGSVMDGKMLEGFKNEPVIGLKFGNLDISVGRNGGVEYVGGRDCQGFGKVSGVEKGKNEVVTRYVVDVVEGNVVDVKVLDGLGERRVNEEAEIEKFRDLLKNGGRKRSPKYGRDRRKQNLMDVNMAETSKGFGHRKGNKEIGGEFGGGRDRRRFGSWKNKQEESGMTWVKKK